MSGLSLGFYLRIERFSFANDFPHYFECYNNYKSQFLFSVKALVDTVDTCGNMWIQRTLKHPIQHFTYDSYKTMMTNFHKSITGKKLNFHPSQQEDE